jgi:ribonuclease HI
MVHRVWIDGACSGNPGPGGYAAWVSARWADDVGAWHVGHAPRTTNNAMEIMALIVGLRATPEKATVLVMTDSANLIGWLKHGWKRRDAGLRPLLAEADRLMAERTVDFEKVDGHSGQWLNDEADRRARAEAERAKSCSCASHSVDEILTESPSVLGVLNAQIVARRPAPAWSVIPIPPVALALHAAVVASARLVFADGEEWEFFRLSEREFQFGRTGDVPSNYVVRDAELSVS